MNDLSADRAKEAQVFYELVQLRVGDASDDVHGDLHKNRTIHSYTAEK